MKVGLSFSKCLVDVYEDTVDYSEILVIVTATNFDPYNDAHWANIWGGYSNGQAWSDYADCEEQFYELTKKLYNGGKLHQPRQYGGFTPRYYSHWLEVFSPMANQEIPAVKKAWDRYQTLAGLTVDPNEW
jgi:hypothetical protein